MRHHFCLHQQNKGLHSTAQTNRIQESIRGMSNGLPNYLASSLDIPSKKGSISLPLPIDYGIAKKQHSSTFMDKISSLPEKIPAFGLLCALMGITMFSLASLIVKLLTEMHAVEVLVFRCVVQFIPYAIITAKQKYPLFGVKGHRLDLGMRCISGTISLITLYMAYRLMPLADSTTIYLSSPVFVTIFAFIILKEPITIIQGLTGIITIVGVFIISKPEFIFGAEESEADSLYDNRILGIILSLVAAVSSAFSLINLRKLKSTPVPVIVMWYSLTVVVIGSVLLPFLDKWVAPKGVHAWLLILAIGAAGVLNQFFQTTALKYESPGPISVTRSFNIVLSFVWEVTIFAEPVEWNSIVGAVLISSCVVVIALNKCYNENPQKFVAILKRIFCCRRDSNESNDLKTVVSSLNTSLNGSLESIDTIVQPNRPVFVI